MNGILTIFLEITLLFILTLLCFRLMGYRSLGDMEPLDYVIVLGIGEILGSPLGGGEDHLIHAVIAIVTLTFFQISLATIYSKMPRLSRVMEGKPVPVIRDGKIIEKNLIRSRIDTDTVREELRIKGVRDEKDVDMAFLEPSGRFSVILKNEATPITPRYIGEKGSRILVENGAVRPLEWESGEIREEEVLAFLRANDVETWEEIETLLYKDGAFFLEKKKK
ncbi:MAG: DUF421 domain-containing protein [Bacillota bacterium]|jgi:uncharacterized membrane protein YcaP (DUF421 family)